jgi:hypothetical protein
VAGALEGLPQGLGIIAAVVGERRSVAKHHADGIRERVGRDQNAESDLGGVEAEGLGHPVHHPLHHEHAVLG